MNKQIKIEIADHVFLADLLEDAAPETCKAVWDMLPCQDEILHVKWSGNAFYFFSPLDLAKAECSRVYGVNPGDIVYNPHVHDAAEHPHEITLIYAEAAMYTVSGTAISNLFARIRPEYLPALYDVGIGCWKHGAIPIKLSRVEAPDAKEAL